MSELFFAPALAADAADTAHAPVPGLLETFFGELSHFKLTTWIALGVLLALGGFVLLFVQGRKKWTTRMLAYAALTLALSFVLSYVRIWHMPLGGSITPGSMLPIMLFAIAFGAVPGMLTGLAYGLLQYIQDPYFLNVWQFLLDYILAFTVLGVAGIARRLPSKYGVFAGILAAVLLRFVSAVLAGLMWAAAYGMSEGFTSPLWYSIVYNGTYLLPEMLICLLLAYMVAPTALKAMKR
jgi:thiamine transporter